MNSPSQSLRFSPRLPVTATRAAVLALCASVAVGVARAEDDPAAVLTTPNSSVEVGVGTTSSPSFKAHEYDGLTRKGAYAIGNFDLRGGGAYDSNDAGRWRIFGRDLGTESPSLGIDVSNQGQWRVRFNYDELLRNRSDSYQTPLIGAGGNTLTLPSTWQVPVVAGLNATAANARGLSPDVTNSPYIAGALLKTPTTAQTGAASAIQLADLAAFQKVELSTKRSRIELNSLLSLSSRWDGTAEIRREERTGLKPMATVTRFTNADISTVIPDLIDQSHNQATVGLAYNGDDLTLQGNYLYSSFTNAVPSMTWANWATPGSGPNSQTMSSAPDNEFNQLALNGNYRFSRSTRLSGSFSRGRGTQNVNFLVDSGTPLVPSTSLHGVVVSTAASLKLSSHPMNGVNLSAGYKYDERDNQTPVGIFGFYDAGEAKTGTSLFNAAFPTAGLGSNANLNANRPYSKRLNQLNLDGDYALTPDQTLRGGVESQKIARWCNGSWIACVDADSTSENTAKLEWSLNANEAISGRVGYAHSSRTVDYNEDAFLALVPMANVTSSSAAALPAGTTAYSTLTALGLTGYGPVLGLNPVPAVGSAAALYFPLNNALANAQYANQNRISELIGMRRYNMADRQRDKLRTGLTWQANEVFALQTGLDFNRDNYDHSVYGLKNAKSWALNLDGTYAATQDLNLNAFVTFEDQRSLSAGNSYTANSAAANVSGQTAISGGCFATIALRNASNKVDPCLDWTTQNRDRVTTLGLAFGRKNLMTGALDVTGAVTYTQARTTNAVSGGNYVNNPYAGSTAAPAGVDPTIAAYFIAATPLPDVVTRVFELRTSAAYRLDDNKTVRGGYMFQRMSSTDYIYDGMQPGGLAGVLPSFEQAPAYKVHTLSLSFVYVFH
jgi:MtrB/PioB family decaheme-associated outer membrane protein